MRPSFLGAHTVTVKLFQVDTLTGTQAEWVSGVQVSLRAENYDSASYHDTDWDGERTLTIPDDAVNPYFQWYKIGCDSGAASYDFAVAQAVVFIPIDCPQHNLTLTVYDEESWNGRTGRRLSDVAIRVDSPRYPYYFRSVESHTDSTGRIILQVPTGDYQVELSRPGCAPASTMLKNIAADRIEALFIYCPQAAEPAEHGR